MVLPITIIIIITMMAFSYIGITHATKKLSKKEKKEIPTMGF